MTLPPLSDDDYDRLARHVAGEGSAVERTATEQWVASDAGRRAAYEELQQSWQLTAGDDDWNVDAAWATLSSGIAEAGKSAAVADAGASKVVPISSRRPWWGNSAILLRAAAVLTIVAGGAAVATRSRGGGPPAGTGEVAATRISTGAGERQTVRLPDGSTVALGVSSTLRTRPGFGDGAREVELEGEALFTVEHDAARPFRVYAGQTVVEDLGTEFAVRSYAQSGEAALRVAVASGSVAVRRGTSADTAVMLSPRDVATVRGVGDIAVARGVDVTPFTAFATGRLMFVDAAFSHVMRDLERWYGVEVRVTDDALLDRHLTGTFERETLAEVLRIISLALDVRFEQDGNRVNFMPKAATSSVPQPPAVHLAEASA